MFFCVFEWERQKWREITYLALFLIEFGYKILTELTLGKWSVKFQTRQFKFQSNHMWVSYNLPIILIWVKEEQTKIGNLKSHKKREKWINDSYTQPNDKNRLKNQYKRLN